MVGNLKGLQTGLLLGRDVAPEVGNPILKGMEQA